MNQHSICGNQPLPLHRTTRNVKMHEFDSDDFAEFYKMYSSYQVVQENSDDNGKDNTIDANDAQ